MKKVPTITVSIPAHNEEKNIASILSDILQQCEDGWQLQEVLVFCDGCTDNTAQKARSLKSSKVKVVDDGQKIGQVQRMRCAAEQAKGDIVVFIDADMHLDGFDVISEIVKQFTANPKVALVGANTRPFPPKTFFQRAVYSTFKVFDASRSLRNGKNPFGCTAGCMAIQRTFLQTLPFPPLINGDDYVYFSCLKAGHDYAYAPEAVAFYKMPLTVKEYVNQMYRSSPTAVVLNFSDEFGDLVTEEYHRPLSWYATTIAKVCLEDPLAVFTIVAINLGIKPILPLMAKRMKPTWETPQTTK